MMPQRHRKGGTPRTSRKNQARRASTLISKRKKRRIKSQLLTFFRKRVPNFSEVRTDVINAVEVGAGWKTIMEILRRPESGVPESDIENISKVVRAIFRDKEKI